MPEALTDAEKTWISRYAGRYPDDQSAQAAVAQSAAIVAARDAELEKARAYLETARAELKAAQEGIQLKSGRTVTPLLHPQAKGIRADSEIEARDVRSSDQLVDSEGEELGKNVEDSEAISKLNRAHARLIELQEHMLSAIGPDGMPLFTDDDVRQELWTPLVREGVLPEGSVADRFSETAIASSGAMDLYKDQIAAYSKDHSKAGDTARQVANLIRGAAEVGSAIAQGVVAIEAAHGMSGDHERTRDLQWKKLKGEELTAAESQELADITARHSEDSADVMRTQSAIAAISTFVIGGVDGVEMVADHVASDDPERNMNTAKRAFDIVCAVLPAVIDTWNAARIPDGASKDQKKALDGEAKFIKLAMKSSFASAQALPRLYGAVMGGSEKSRLMELAGAVDAIANAVASGFAASAAKIKNDDPGGHRGNEAAELERHGQKVANLIRSSAKLAQLAEALRLGKGKEAAMLLAAGALMSSMTIAVSDDAATEAAQLGNMGGVADRPVDPTQTQAERDAADAAAEQIALGQQGKFDDALTKQIDDIASGLIEFVQPDDPEDAALQQALEEEIRKEQLQAYEDALTNLSSPESVESIRNDIEAELLGVQEMYSTAMPPQGGLSAEELVAAQKAIDKAMKQGEEINAALTILEMIADGGMSALASVYPGASIAIAGKKLIKDAMIVKKKWQLHNSWCDVQITALAGQGGAAAAIQNTVHNAKVQRNCAGADAVISMLDTAGTVARTVDPTGIGLAVSGSVKMASALNKAVQNLHGWNEVRKGWNAYKAACDDPANRRLAREALRLNSTLAKCCIAYGATELNDPAAKQAMMRGGLSIAAIQNDKDICVTLVSYLQKELVDDPTVLKVELSSSTKWFPGKPELTHDGWRRFVSAAAAKADPPLHSASRDTPAIDRLLTLAPKADAWPDPDKVLTKKVEDLTPAEVTETIAQIDRGLEAIENAVPILERTESAFAAYRPMAAGSAGVSDLIKHPSMPDAANAFATLARWRKDRAKADQAALTAMRADLLLRAPAPAVAAPAPP